MCPMGEKMLEEKAVSLWGEETYLIDQLKAG